MMITRIKLLLASPRLGAYLAIVAIVLTSLSLRTGWLLDDHFHRMIFSRPQVFPEWDSSPWRMFTFMNGDVERTRQIMDVGLVPWWTYPEIRASFWRPVTAVTHWIDYRLWPNAPMLMHLHSMLWYGLLAALTTVLYRRLITPAWVAGLAALLYAIDDAHGMPVGWIANRNAVISTVFGVACLIAHHVWRARRRRRWALASVPLLALSLLSAEGGIGICAYLAAYALFIDPDRWPKRLASLLPYLAVVIVWRLAWNALGHGVTGLGLYVDPIREPLGYLVNLGRNGAVLLSAQWLGPPAELVALTPGYLGLWLLASLLIIAGIAWLVVPLVRESAVARFWATGMLLALLPLGSTFPADRLLFFVGLGAMGLLAGVIQRCLESGVTRPRKMAVCLLSVVHLGIAAPALAARAAYPTGPPSLFTKLIVRTPMDESVRHQSLIIINTPSASHALYLPITRMFEGKPYPARTRVLAPAIGGVTVHRDDARTLRIRPALGYLTFAFDVLFRDENHPMKLGERVRLSDMEAEVTELTPDGRPAEVVFRFTKPLEDASLRWLKYADGEFVPFTPPPIGSSVVLPADFPL